MPETVLRGASLLGVRRQRFGRVMYGIRRRSFNRTVRCVFSSFLSVSTHHPDRLRIMDSDIKSELVKAARAPAYAGQLNHNMIGSAVPKHANGCSVTIVSIRINDFTENIIPLTSDEPASRSYNEESEEVQERPSRYQHCHLVDATATWESDCGKHTLSVSVCPHCTSNE